MTDQNFVLAAKRVWGVWRKHQPLKAKLLLAKMQRSSPTFLCYTKKSFAAVCKEFWDIESDPAVFEFLNADWKKAKDLMVFASCL